MWTYDLMVHSDPEYTDSNNSGLGDVGDDGDSPFSWYKPFTAMLTIMAQLFASSSVIGPALFVIAVIIRQPRLNNYRYWFIANLLVCVMLVAMVFLPAAVNTASQMFTDQVSSMQFIVNFTIIPSLACCFMSCVVFADMFCFLFFANYQNYLTPKKSVVMAMAAWVMASAVVLVLSTASSSGLLSDHIILLVVSIILLMVKIIIGVAVLCLNVFLFYYWTKVNVRLQEEVLNLPSAESRSRLHKQIDVFVRVESSIKPFFAFFSISLFNVAIEIVKVIIAGYTSGFYNAPISFVTFIALTWLECVCCVLTYSVLLIIIFHWSCSKSNKIVPT